MWLKVLNLATGRLMSKTAIECLETSHLSGLFSYGDLIVKLFIRNLCFLQILEKITHQKLKKITVNYESTTNQINVYFFLAKKIKRLIILIAIESLLYLTPFQAKVNFCTP